MYDELSNYLSKHITVTDELLEAIKVSSIITKYKKGSIILREGDDNKNSFFVLKGCVRKYILKNDEEVTIDIFTDEQAVIPSNANLECLMDSIILKSNEYQEQLVINKFPELKNLCLKMAEMLAEKILNEYTVFKSSNPEERYQILLENKPELLEIVPQYQIASYLGIKPESLSRIKKRIKLNLSQ